MRRATSADVSSLVTLMAEFYAESGYQLDRENACQSFSTLLEDERLGSVWILQCGGPETEVQAAGHLVITLRYAMEFGGMIACLDDLYVRPPFRNRGLATQALADARQFCLDAGIRAMTVEVSHGNTPAQKVYRRAGYADLPDRQLLALPLAPPAHFE